LITHRDDYLKHSSKNYTLEQKQYNNWLTQQLLDVAELHNYVFDPEDFNFVSIRDRIRCYYKSYVQIARKRGLSIPRTRVKAEPSAVKIEAKKKVEVAAVATEGAALPPRATRSSNRTNRGN
jgi:hypothetical protein